MKYYIVKNSSDIKVIGGTYPQCTRMSAGYDYDADNSIYRIQELTGKHIEGEVNTNAVVLGATSKMTDCLSMAMVGRGGFLVNHKILEILSLKEFQTVEYQIINVPVMYKKTNFEYFWIHFHSDWRNYVDYKKSKFRNYFDKSYKLPGFENLNELLNFKDPDRTYFQIVAEKLVMLPQFPRDLDIIFISQFDINIYFSEKLVSKILTEKITGFEFNESNLHFE